MNVKKAGLVGAGVLTVLVAASPLAWAVGPSAQAPDGCAFVSEGTDGTQESVITEDAPANLVPQVPQAGNNQGVFGECSTFNNDNGQGNGLGNTFNGEPIPAPGLD